MYYKYFRNIIKSQGVPQINNEELIRLLDIAYFEGAINFLKHKKEKTTNSELRYRHDIDIKALEKQVERLINGQYGDIYPKEVLNGMLLKSRG